MIKVLLALLTSFSITFVAIPSIIKVARMKNLFDEPGERKSHHSKIPTLGGVALFAGIIFAFTFWTAESSYQPRQYIIASLIIMFFIGIKDDIIPLSPIKKFIGQLMSAGIIVFFSNPVDDPSKSFTFFRLTNMVGVLGVYELPVNVSYILTIFTILVIINAYNLIDGIDGLAAGIGVIASFTFGIFLYMVENTVLATLSFALCGSLLAFLYFNLSNAKIFMGDTGSLIVGLILSILAINFIEANINNPKTSEELSQFFQKHFNIQNISIDLSRSAPAIAIGILIIPLFDTLRVFFFRAIRRTSPFRPDRNHIHHKIIALGLNHKKASFILYFVNILFIALSFSLRNLHSGQILLILGILAASLSQIPYLLKLYKKKKSVS
jgi:UDP-GlcNAc:undecaprenyl-phosphate GlcNAc-1-phosphate transferase